MLSSQVLEAQLDVYSTVGVPHGELPAGELHISQLVAGASRT